jgi:hypothetical protein
MDQIKVFSWVGLGEEEPRRDEEQTKHVGLGKDGR